MSNTEEFVNTQPRIKTRKSTKSDMLPMTITLAPIDLKSNNLPLAWKKWLTKLKVYLRANNLENETDSRKEESQDSHPVVKQQYQGAQQGTNVQHQTHQVQGTHVIGVEKCTGTSVLQKVFSVENVKNSTILLISINCQDIVKSNADSFEGLGCLADFYCELTLKPNATPFIEACRRIPLQLQQPLKQELEAMEQSGVIQRVEEPTEWEISHLRTLLSKDTGMVLVRSP
ncbi:unnamed protein product, partial [Brenthis ino]